MRCAHAGTVRHVHLQTLFSLRFPSWLRLRNLASFAENVEMVARGDCTAAGHALWFVRPKCGSLGFVRPICGPAGGRSVKLRSWLRSGTMRKGQLGRLVHDLFVPESTQKSKHISVARCPGHNHALDESDGVVEHDAHDREQHQRAEGEWGARLRGGDRDEE